MTATDHTDRRAEAWELGGQGYYDAAFDILEDLLKEMPTDVVSLRMKGNLLELKALEAMEHSRKKLTSSIDYLAARDCYERVLQTDPRHIKAYIDLGDHYRNLDANDRALEYYGEAVRLLQQMPKDETWNEDVEELGKALALLTKHERIAAEASLLEAWCREALGTSGSGKSA